MLLENDLLHLPEILPFPLFNSNFVRPEHCAFRIHKLPVPLYNLKIIEKFIKAAKMAMEQQQAWMFPKEINEWYDVLEQIKTRNKSVCKTCNRYVFTFFYC